MHALHHKATYITKMYSRGCMWGEDDYIQTTFFKCRNWQLEETLDPHICPYHYYCNSLYPGDYSPAVDLVVLIFTFLSFSTTIAFMVIDMAAGGARSHRHEARSRRYLLPSGPLSLPITVLIMANGYRINTLFPMSTSGPAILQLIRISALAFNSHEEGETTASDDAKYVFLESSTISGVLHAALYLDSVVLPYYTGMDALALSVPSGECRSCVCRDRALTVGGTLVVFRGWSVTTAVVAATLFLRIVRRVLWRRKGSHKFAAAAAELTRVVLETLSWILIGVESVYLAFMVVGDNRRAWPAHAAYAGVFVLMCLQIARKACAWNGVQLYIYATRQTVTAMERRC